MSENPLNTFYLNPKFKEVIDKCFNGIQPLLNTKKVMYSLIMNRWNGKVNLINKIEGETPQLPYDWDMYLILKAIASTIIITGEIVKGQKGYNLFHNHNPFYDPALLKLHLDKNQSKQKLFILSNTITEEQVQSFVKEQYYEPFVIAESHKQTRFKTISQEKTLNDYFNKIIPKNGGPILFESGLTTMKKYLETTQQNMFDLFIIGQYNGKLPQKVIGKQLQFDYQNYFDIVFSSQEIPCYQGFVSYKLYTPKKRQ